MLISTAYAQSATGGSGSGLEAFLPLILIFVVFYFLLIRPQQKKMKEHKAMLGAIKRGDQIITGGGILGKVNKVGEDGILQVDIADGVRVRIAQDTVASVIDKTRPVAGAPANQNERKGGLLSSLFGGGGAAPQQPAPANTESDAPAAGDAPAADGPAADAPAGDATDASGDQGGPAADPKKD